MTPRFPLKDHLFNPPKVQMLADQIGQVFSDFDVLGFVQAVVSQFPHLEFKQRISHMTECLHRFLPASYEQAVAIILDSLPPALDESHTDDDFGDFIYAPYGAYIARYGCVEEFLPLSFRALEQITMRFSVEFALRDFWSAFPDETMQQSLSRAQHPNYHVRRLVSEWSRPTLPWWHKIGIPIWSTIPLLDLLWSDPTRYVVRSVANHLHDISKKNPNLIFDTLERRQHENATAHRQSSQEMRYLVRHTLRTLIKQGDRYAWAMIGYHEPVLSQISLNCAEQVQIGQALVFRFQAVSQAQQTLHVTYTIHFASASGRPSSKTFVLANKMFATGEQIDIRRSHPIRQMSTRKIVSGMHELSIACCGKVLGRVEFEVE